MMWLSWWAEASLLDKILQTNTQYFILINFCVLWSQQSCIIHSLHNFLVLIKPIGRQTIRTLKIHSNFQKWGRQTFPAKSSEITVIHRASTNRIYDTPTWWLFGSWYGCPPISSTWKPIGNMTAARQNNTTGTNTFVLAYAI